MASGVSEPSALPLLLAVETATRVMSVALLDGERVVAEITSDDERVHSERLLPAIDRLLELAGVSLVQVGAFAVSIGPGSFTGLRIGLATLKAFALDEARPLVPVSTLAALCAAAAGARGPVAALLDARRGEVYAAAVAMAGDAEPTLLPDSVFTPEELATALPPETTLVIGEDAEPAAARLCLLRPDLQPLAAGEGAARATRVARLGRLVLAAGRAVPAAELVPRYVRRAEAEARRTGEALERVPESRSPR
jgi:tRNA threonylcarbamoyladenosine biosynthesis protein TsaB